jgi:hypothetical protein
MTDVDKDTLSSTEPYTIHFVLECSADRMPLGDGSIEGPRYAKGFHTLEAAREWIKTQGRQLRVVTAWTTSTLPEGADEPSPPSGNKNGLKLVH